jgi:predicted transcriptional regulator
MTEVYSTVLFDDIRLSELQQHILKILETGPKFYSDIEKELQKSHATIYENVEVLHNKGFVRIKKQINPNGYKRKNVIRLMEYSVKENDPICSQ